MSAAKLSYNYTHSIESEPLVSALRINTNWNKEKDGFYLEHAIFGRQLKVDLEVDMTTSNMTHFLIWKTLTKEKLLKLSEVIQLNPLLTIYILAHKLFDVDEILKQLELGHINSKNIRLLCCENSANKFIYSYQEITMRYPNYTKIGLQFEDEKLLKNKSRHPMSYFPYVLIDVLKCSINPLIALWQNSQIYYKRFLEIIDFLHFLIFKFYWFIRYQYFKRIKKQIWTE